MAVKKGSIPPPVKVVPHRPLRQWCLTLASIVLVALALVGSYHWGYQRGGGDHEALLSERNRLQQSLHNARVESDDLRQEVANLKLGSMVDLKAGEEVRSQTVELKAQIARLEEDIAFYRSLMAPDDNNRGLTIGSLNVLSTGTPRQYEYQLVVQQLATSHELLNGHLTFEVVGRTDGQQRTLPLYRLSGQVDEAQIKLRFRYFQNIEGRLELPEGFEPERIEVVARSTGRNADRDEKNFGWLVQE